LIFKKELTMDVRQQFALAAALAIFCAMPAHAADDKAMPEKPAPTTEKPVTPHSHAVEKGTIPPSAVPTAEEKKHHKPVKKPRHEHKKEKN
jgi:hypothetical protein